MQQRFSASRRGKTGVQAVILGLLVFLLGMTGVVPVANANETAKPQVNLSDGQVVSGPVDLALEGEGALSLEINGVAQDLNNAVPGGKVVFNTASYDLTYDYSLFINDVEVGLPKAAIGETGASGASDSVESDPFPAGTLLTGQENTIRFVSGLRTDGRPDRVYVEDFEVILDDGTVFVDEESAGNRISVGYDRVPYEFEYPFNVAIPNSTFVWDTTALEDGEYTLVVTGDNGSTSVTVQVDNVDPLSVSLEDGQTVSGTTMIGVSGDGSLGLQIDGSEITDLETGVPGGTVTFAARSYEGTARDYLLYINDTLVALPNVDAAAGGGGGNDGELLTSSPFPAGVLQAGVNTFRFVPGMNNNGVPDRVYVKDFTVVLSDGTEFIDPVSRGQMVDVGYDREVYEFEYPFEIDVTGGYAEAHYYAWDTTALRDGSYEVTVRDEQFSRSVTVLVDNHGPVITWDGIADGETYRGEDLTVGAVSEDAIDGSVPVTLELNGSEIENGSTISSEMLGNGSHELTATATDSNGNTSTSALTFSTYSVYPGQATDPLPEVGESSVSPDGAELSVTVSDPAGQNLDVRFLRAHTVEAKADQLNVVTGSSQEGVPTVGEGESLPTPFALTDDSNPVVTSVDNAYPYQQYEIDVSGDVSADSPVQVSWTGSVPMSHWAVLSVWDYGAQTWVEVASEKSIGDDLELSGSVDTAEAVQDGKVTVAVQNRPPFVAKSVDGVTTFGWVSDTQYYSAREPETFSQITQWIADTAEARNISYSIHTGDIVDTATNEDQWVNADRALRNLDDANHPYGVVAGNHDFGGAYANYRKYVGEHRFKDGIQFQETVDDNIQHTDYISTPEADFLVVYLTWRASEVQWQWVKDQIAAHPDANVIIATHEQFDVDGTLVGQGLRLLEELIEPFPNVDLILSGHKQTSYTWVHRLDDDRVALQMQQNYQHVRTGGSLAGGGFLRLLSFDSRNDTLTNETYSVLNHATNAWPVTSCESLTNVPAVADEMSEPCIKSENFVRDMTVDGITRTIETDEISLQVFGDEELGFATGVASGSRAAITADLAPDSDIFWYASITNEDGFTSNSEVWSFQTAAAAGSDEPGSTPGDGADGSAGGSAPGDTPPSSVDRASGALSGGSTLATTGAEGTAALLVMGLLIIAGSAALVFSRRKVE